MSEIDTMSVNDGVLEILLKPEQYETRPEMILIDMNDQEFIDCLGDAGWFRGFLPQYQIHLHHTTGVNVTVLDNCNSILDAFRQAEAEIVKTNMEHVHTVEVLFRNNPNMRFNRVALAGKYAEETNHE